MTLQDRIIKVLSMERFGCVWPTRRAVNRLWIDDQKIPDNGIRLWFTIKIMQYRGIVKVHNGFIGLLK